MQISERALKSVAFIGIKDRGKFRPRATCFFAKYTDFQYNFDHIVTAEHVISGLQLKGLDIWVRFNLRDGSVKEIQIDPRAFRFHPNNAQEATDVAVCPFRTSWVDQERAQWLEVADIEPISLNGPNSFSPNENFPKELVALGSEIAIIGLFRSHYGENRNVPILRVGNIASLLGEPISTKYAGYIQAYLIEARSIAGLSGSPVFVVRSPEFNVINAMARAQGKNTNTKFIALLGLVHGHFDPSSTVRARRRGISY